MLFQVNFSSSLMNAECCIVKVSGILSLYTNLYLLLDTCHRLDTYLCYISKIYNTWGTVLCRLARISALERKYCSTV